MRTGIMSWLKPYGAMTLLLIGVLLISAATALAQEAETEEPPVTEEAVVEEAAEETGEEAEETQEEESYRGLVVATLEPDVVYALEPTGDNGYCVICHNQPLRTVRLADGEVLNLYVNPEMIVASVHGPKGDRPGLGCIDCHGEDAFPHNQPEPVSGRLYTLDKVELCTQCHVTQGEELSQGLHAMAIADGNIGAAVCTDCHGAHHIQSAENHPELVAGVCGDCHETTLDEWQMSPHADIGPQGCAACHSYHAQTLRVGTTSTELCLNCHADMEPVFIHETHINDRSEVACADCHMYTEDVDTQLVAFDMRSTGHTMELDARPCTTCHEDMVATGEWTQLVASRDGVEVEASPDGETEQAEVVTEAPADPAEAPADPAEAPADPAEAPADPAEAPADPAEAPADPAEDNLMFIIQGLLVGLGLGATFTIVFVTRSNRRSA